MKKRGSYFFVLDVFLSGAILILTLIVILNSRSNAPDTVTQFTLAEEFLNFMATTEFRDVTNIYRVPLQEGGYINRTDWNLDQVVASLNYEEGYVSDASATWSEFPPATNLSYIFVSSLQSGLIPNQYGIIYAINETHRWDPDPDLNDNSFYHVVFNRTPGVALENASVVMTARRLTFFPIDVQNVYGPVITEVIVWI